MNLECRKTRFYHQNQLELVFLEHLRAKTTLGESGLGSSRAVMAEAGGWF